MRRQQGLIPLTTLTLKIMNGGYENMSDTARQRLTYLFDNGEFTELGALARSGDDLSGVITAYGYVEGSPVYAFSQDISVRSGAIGKAQADKIARVYDLASRTGVPVVGIYDSCGADLSDGFAALDAYGELLMWASNLSGVVPQISVVAGVCAGCSAMMAACADFVVATREAEVFVTPNSKISDLAENAAKNGLVSIVADNDEDAVKKAKELVSKLPQNNLSPLPVYEYDVSSATWGENAKEQAQAVCDAGSVTEVGASYGRNAYTALATIGGSTVGICGTDIEGGKLTADDCAKIARFVRICDSFAAPVITLVNTEGFEVSDEAEAAGAVKSMARLAHAYAEATTVKLSVITGKAYGAAYIALAGKNANADMTFALPQAVISPVDPLTAAEILSHDELKGAEDTEAKREALASEYITAKASAERAAEHGGVELIADASVLRDTLISALDIMAGKRISRLPKKHSNIPM